MKVGVIGGGVVGKATARTYLEFVDEVRVYDQKPELSTHTSYEVVRCDLVFICLPEAEVLPFLTGNGTINREGSYVIKSTVPVGTTKRLSHSLGIPNMIHCPEFLTERCAEVDALIPPQIIVGYPYEESLGGNKAFHEFHRLCGRRFPATHRFSMTSDESEMVKLTLNAFFATKVAFFNEVQEACSKLGLDYESVRAGVLGDGRVTTHHTQVPGRDGKHGFGGKCLPKDLDALIHLLYTRNLPAPVLRAAAGRNLHDRSKG